MIDSTLSFVTALVGIVLSLIFFGVLYRRKQKQSGILNLVAYQSLGAKKGVAALQVGQEILLVGVMPNGLRVLKTIAAGEIQEKKKEASTDDRMEKLRKLSEEIDE
jgi:flagellar biogenesis protein FliO